MPSQQPSSAPAGKRRVCQARTTTGQRCGRTAVAGLTVCKSHGGGTAASVRKSTRAKVADQVHSLWGIAPDAGSVSVEEELVKLARNKRADIIALRLKISADELSDHIGLLRTGRAHTEYDIEGTVQSKSGSQTSTTRAAGTSVWVQELHKAEAELVVILRALQEVTGGTEESDLRRVRMQTAREAARLLKAFPGMGVDEVAAEVAKKAS